MIVSIDVGFSFTKGAIRIGNNANMKSLPSLVTRNLNPPTNFLGTEHNLRAYEKLEVNGKAYYVGEVASKKGAEPHNDISHIFEQEYEVKIASILTKLGVSDNEAIDLVLTLPMIYFSNYAEDLENHYRGRTIHVRSVAGDRTYHIHNVFVVAQGASALAYAVGQEKLLSGTYGVIEVGSYTVDYVLFEKFEPVSFGSVSAATSKVIFTLRDLIANEGLPEIRFEEVDELIRNFVKTGELRVRINTEKIVDLTEQTKDILESVANEFLRKILNDFNANLHSTESITLAGGGTDLFKTATEKALRKRTKLVVPTNPQFANAFGALKIGYTIWT